MGSTDRRYDDPTMNPAINLFKRGDFVQAKKELLMLRSGASSLDALVMLAICDYRLGNTTALTRLRQDVVSKLTAAHQAQLLHHEFIGLIKDTRFDAAVQLLENNQLLSVERDSLTLIRMALRVLKDGQQTATLKRRPERFGIVTPREIRSRYLPEAKSHCSSVVIWMESHNGDAAGLILVMGRYMLLLIEMMMSSDMRDTGQIRTLRQQLGGVDKDFKKSLPSSFQPTKFSHRF